MAAPATLAEPQASGASGAPQLPVCLLVLGMAGSGKTTFVQVTCTVWRLYWRLRPGRKLSGELEGMGAWFSGGLASDSSSFPKPRTLAWVT